MPMPSPMRSLQPHILRQHALHLLSAARVLEAALVITFVAHGLAMLSMIAFLLPGLPGGTTAEDAARIAYIAAHPWLWRLGWLPWQITAGSDLLLAIALLRTPWIPAFRRSRRWR